MDVRKISLESKLWREAAGGALVNVLSQVAAGYMPVHDVISGDVLCAAAYFLASDTDARVEL